MANATLEELVSSEFMAAPINDVSDSIFNTSLVNDTSLDVVHKQIITDGQFQMSGYPSGYSTLEVYIISLAAILLMAVIIIGNSMVIVAIFFEYSLQCVQNWFVASLALSDLAIGIVIMPISLSQEVLGYWLFGGTWCQLHSALDVLLCTASILNLTLIALDRYWSITKAVEYLNFRTETSVTIMICVVWFLSVLVSLPPFLYPPWRLPYKKPLNNEIAFEPSDRLILDPLNATEELVYSRCPVSTLYCYFLLTQPLKGCSIGKGTKILDHNKKKIGGHS